ncbi:MAG TPA: RNA polymerase sigma factor SigW [Candidatus Magasanikbacteria bacterium]|nr:RNA polymerase sigma factor SigW [Candidatus Magasanikbacteria bacterium]
MDNHERDEAIAQKVQKGDQEAFGVLVDRYLPKMTRYAKKFLFSHDDAQDVVQEVFIKAYTNIQSFDTNRAFSSWIYRIAHNEYINALAKKKHISLITLNLDTLFPTLRSSTQPDIDLNKKEMERALNASLKHLPVKYREPLVLYYFEDLDYQHIADVLHLPVSTVGVRLSRGKALLKKYYHP